MSLAQTVTILLVTGFNASKGSIGVATTVHAAQLVEKTQAEEQVFAFLALDTLYVGFACT